MNIELTGSTRSLFILALFASAAFDSFALQVVSSPHRHDRQPLQYRTGHPDDFDTQPNQIDGNSPLLIDMTSTTTTATTTSVTTSVTTTTTVSQSKDAPLMSWTDVDADRTSLASLLQPPAPPLVPRHNSNKASRSTSRSSPVISLNSLSDYQRHVLPQRKLSLLRFHAPWCQTCRSTSIAYERLASLFLPHKSHIDFYSVLLDNNNAMCEKNQLKEMLQVTAVPMGVLVQGDKGVVGRVVLNRGNLAELKKRLMGYLGGALSRQGEMMWMEALVTGLTMTMSTVVEESEADIGDGR